ncbi:hypothetical protein BDR03DRAFT_982886 [Suillus americanus]|nr:hypothetical protein BDR03DRAFT_982886 [Suillus americanus]
MYQSKKGIDRVQSTLQDSDRQANSSWAQAVITCFGIGTNLRPVLRPVNRDVQQDASASIETAGRGDNEEVSPIPTVQSQQHVLTGLFFSPAETVSRGNIPQENLAIAQLRDEDFLIPVKYWGEFFKKSKGHAHSVWDSIKVEWGNWKFIAEEWERFSDADAFWSEYSNPETHNKLLYQQILNCLVVHRAEKAAQDAADAQEFFGGNLNCPDADRAFQYSKRGRTHLLSKDDAIAKRWKELLNTRPDITLQLAQMHSARPAA